MSRFSKHVLGFFFSPGTPGTLTNRCTGQGSRVHQSRGDKNLRDFSFTYPDTCFSSEEPWKSYGVTRALDFDSATRWHRPHIIELMLTHSGRAVCNEVNP